MFKGLGFRSRFVISFSLILLITCLGGAIIIYEAGRIARDVTEINDQDLPRALHADDIALQAVQVQQWLTDVSATGDPGGYTEARAAADQFRVGLQELRDLYKLEASERERTIRHAELDALEQDFEAFYSLGLRMAAAYLGQGRAAGNRLMGEFDGRSEALTKRLALIRERNLKQVRGNLRQVREFTNLAQWAIVIQMILTLGACVTIGFVLTRSIMRPVDAMGGGLRAILDQNNLSLRIENRSRSEIGEITDWINTFVDSIGFLVLQIQNYLGHLVKFASELDTSAARVAEIAQSQASSTEEASAALEQLSSSSDHIAGSVSGQAEQIQRIDANMQALNAALQEINSTAESMNSLADQSAVRADEGHTTMSAGIESMDRIRQQAARISEIVGIINGISDKTNLLALNASIEAARAGEAGRGFAVVASEISKLAEHTAHSVQEIEELVMQTGEEVERGSEQVAKTAAALRQITADTRVVRSSVAAVRDSLREQGARTREIGTSVSSVATAAQEIELASVEQKGTAFETTRNMTMLSDETQRLASDAAAFQQIGTSIAAIAASMKELATLYRVDARRELFSFGRAFQSGDLALDREHRGLFDILNRLHATSRSPENGDIAPVSVLELTGFIDEIDKYFSRHLPSEEETMRVAKYPDLVQHQLQHQDIQKWLGRFRQRVVINGDEDGRNDLRVAELLTRMGTWINSHVLLEDRRFAQFRR